MADLNSTIVRGNLRVIEEIIGPLKWSNITDKPIIYRHDLLIRVYESSPKFYANISCTVFNKSNTPITSISSLYDKISSKEISANGSVNYLNTYYNPIITFRLPNPNVMTVEVNTNTITDNKLTLTSLTAPSINGSNSNITDTVTSIAL